MAESRDKRKNFYRESRMNSPSLTIWVEEIFHYIDYMPSPTVWLVQSSVRSVAQQTRCCQVKSVYGGGMAVPLVFF